MINEINIGDDQVSLVGQSNSQQIPLIKSDFSSKFTRMISCIIKFIRMAHFVRIAHLSQRQYKSINDVATNIEFPYKSDSEQQLAQRKKYLAWKKRQKNNSCWDNLKIFLLTIQYHLISARETLYTFFSQHLPVFGHRSVFILIWEFIHFSLSLFYYIFIPYRLAFERDQERVFTTTFLQPIILTFFLLDIVKLSRTAFFQKGELITDSRIIFISYVSSRYIIFDLITSFSILNFIKSEPIWQLLFLLRALYKPSSIKKLKTVFHFREERNVFFKLLRLSTLIIYLCHLIACIWFKIGVLEAEDNSTGWLVTYKFIDAPLGTQYLNSFFFATIMISSIKGNIFPLTNAEKIFAIFIAFIASILAGFIFNSIGIILRELNSKKEAQQKKISAFKAFLSRHNIPASYKTVIQKYLEYIQNRDNTDLVVYQEILKLLPKSLRHGIQIGIYSQVRNIQFSMRGYTLLGGGFQRIKCNQLNMQWFLWKQSLENIPYLKENFSRECLERLALKVHSKMLGPDEEFINKQKYFEPCLIYIFKGEVQEFLRVHQSSTSPEDVRQLEIKKKGTTVGEFEFFTNQKEPIKYARSIGETEIHILRLADFDEVLKKYPHEREVYATYRDQLLFNKKLSMVRIDCTFCKETFHYESQCPYTFYENRTKSILSRYNHFVEMQRQSRVRSFVRKKTNSLSKAIPKLRQCQMELIELSDQKHFEIKEIAQQNKIKDLLQSEMSEISNQLHIEDSLHSENISSDSVLEVGEQFQTHVVGQEVAIKQDNQNSGNRNSIQEEEFQTVKEETGLNVEQSIENPIQLSDFPKGESNAELKFGFINPGRKSNKENDQKSTSRFDKMRRSTYSIPFRPPLFKIHTMSRYESGEEHITSKESPDIPDLTQILEKRIKMEREILMRVHQNLQGDNFSTLRKFDFYFPRNNVDNVLARYQNYQKRQLRKWNQK